MHSLDEQSQREAQRLELALVRVRLRQAFGRRTVVVWAIAALILGAGVFVLGGEYLGVGELAERVVLNGALMPERVAEGEWWRLLSGTWLHRSWPHLLTNLAGLLLIGRAVEVAFGRAGFIVLYVGAGLAGAAGTVTADHLMSVGASGAVFGLIAAFAAMGLRLWPRLPPRIRRSLIGVPVVLVVGLLILGVLSDDGASQTDVAAHLGGSLGGLALGLILPMHLRDLEDQPLGEISASWTLRVVALVALLAFVISAVAIGELMKHAGRAPSVFVPAQRHRDVGGTAISLPTGYRSGVWRTGFWRTGARRAGRCDGVLVDPVWTLRSHRVACFALPVGGTLLVGRPDQLLTLDAGDQEAMARAWRERRFVWRQPNVLIAPASRDLLFVARGHAAMLTGYAAALAALLPAPDDRPWHPVVPPARDHSGQPNLSPDSRAFALDPPAGATPSAAHGGP